MAEKTNETQNKVDLKKYAYGALAGRFLQSTDNKEYVTGALDAFAAEYLTPESKGFVEGAYASEEGIKKATQVYNNKFQEEYNKSTGNDLKAWYGSVLEGLTDSEKSKIEKALTEHGTKTVKDINKEVQKAQYILQAPEGERTDEEKKAARDSLQKYQNFFVMGETLSQYKFEEFRPKAVSMHRTRTLKDLTSKL